MPIIQRRSPEYANGHGNDQLAEIFATVNMNVPFIDADNGAVEILSDGSDGTAIVCVVGDAKPFISLLDALWSVLQWKQGTEMPFDIRTDYILESGISCHQTTYHSTLWGKCWLPRRRLRCDDCDGFSLNR